MAYFNKAQKRQSSTNNKNRHLSSVQPSNNCDNNQSKHSYLKAFKKYYIQKLLNPNIEKENDTRPKPKCSLNQRRQSQPQNQKVSIMTDSTINSRGGSKISRNKIVDFVNNSDSHIEQILYSSISEVEQQMMTFGTNNDLAKQNKLLKASLAKLKLILKQKLQVALKKNKEEITTMFEQYSTMIKKLLQDKEALTNHLEAVKANYTSDQKRWQDIQQSYSNQIAIIVKENKTQISNTKQQVQEFLQIIYQYQEQANQQKIQVQNLREKLVELQMENDRLKKNSAQSQSQQSFNGETNNYISKMKDMLVMLNEVETENNQLKQFLKGCKCSEIQSSQHSLIEKRVEEIIGKYERQMVEIEKEYLKEQSMYRQALANKDECIERLNLIIDQLRKQRYESVDKMTQSTLQARRELKQHSL